MENSLDLAKIEIPFGVLHDQILEKVACQDNTMVFTFAVQLFPEDYNYGHDVYEKYLPYKHCDMLVDMAEEPFNYFLLETALDRRSKYRGISLERTTFLDVANHADEMTFLSCGVDPNVREFQVLFGIQFRPKGAYRKYRKYGMCRVELNAERVRWNWY